MAVSELEQRFTPLVESQSQAWRPWGPAGRYGLHEDGEESDSDAVPLVRPLRRTSSWSGYITQKLHHRFEQDAAPAQEEDNLPGVASSRTDEHDEHRHLREFDWPSTPMVWSNSPTPAHLSGSSMGSITFEDLRIPTYASVGQYSESQVDKAAEQYQFPSEMTDATFYPSESCGGGCQFSSEWSDATYQSEDFTSSQEFSQWSQVLPRLSEGDLGSPGRESFDATQDGFFAGEVESMEPSPNSPPAYSSERSSTGRRRSERRSRRPSLGVEAAAVAEITTLMVQNLPYSLSREDFLAEIDRSGFAGLYNFCHLPRVFKTGKNQGFAFVNFVSQEAAGRFAEEWHRDRSRLGLGPTCKGIRIKTAAIQGIEACEKIADSKKMKRVKTGTFKPLVIGQGSEASPEMA